MRGMSTRWLLLAGLLLACGPKAPPASETLPRLREAMAAPVSSAEQNKQNSDLVEQISEAGYLLGLTREEVMEKIGKGDDCSGHPICAKQGFDAMDWYYEVGTEGEGYMRSRPALVLGFDRFGKVVRTYNLRIE
jgi:hypothetical protein